MAGLRINIADSIGTSTVSAEVPHDVEMRRLIPALLTSMNRPLIREDGRLFSYRLYHNGKEILDDQTFAQVGVNENETLVLSAVATEDVSAAWALKVTPFRESFEIPIRPPQDSADFLARIDAKLTFDERARRGGGPPTPPVKPSPQGPDGNRAWVCLWDLVQVCIRPQVGLPVDAEMKDLVPAIAAAEGLPVVVDGIDLPYELRLKSGRRLRMSETLKTADVNHGDTLFFMLGESGEDLHVAGWQCACGQVGKPDWRYCLRCGGANQHWRNRCRNGHSLPTGALFCPYCGLGIDDTVSSN